MRLGSRLTLGQVFYLSLVGLVLLLAALFAVVLEGSRRSIVQSSERLREAYADRIGDELRKDLLEPAAKSLENLERQIRSGALRSDDPLSLESALFVEILNNKELAEVTLTHADLVGRGEDGVRLAPSGRWQISVFRDTPETDSPVFTRVTAREGAGFVSLLRRRAFEAGLLDAPLHRERPAADPTEHVTFTTPVADQYGNEVWTDLWFSELDARLPEARRRVVLNVMKTVEDRQGRFVGVLRVGSRAEQIDHITQMTLARRGEEDPHRKFLLDAEGRLVTRLSDADWREAPSGDVRVHPAALPAEVDLALRDPLLHQVTDEGPAASGQLVAEGRTYLVTFRSLEGRGSLPRGGLHDWRIAILVPEEFYLGELRRIRGDLLAVSALVIAALVAGGTLTLTAVRRALSRIVNETARMRRFEFTASPAEAPFRDVREAMESLELAKTAMRAMGKYVPVDLVRRLYETNRDPVLGGQLLEVSLMFTDIKDFTTLAERLTPDRLARALGLYLEAMTGAIHATEGTVDKYIGDAVMALWNAPRPCADHALRACRAALACVESTARLYASPAWEGLPALVTRFGLNRDRVMVGHFGAPDRLSYTALGDGVNLASRVEGLNKQYGTTILATESVHEAMREAFAFRRLDRVAVKGKTQGTLVYELLGPAGPEERPEAVVAYEQALEAYFARDFARALERLEAHPDDPPSHVLAERCRRLRTEPPPPGWDGIYVATMK